MIENILLDETGTEPIRLENEYFILKKTDISYQIIDESNATYSGEGYLILTSNRLLLFPIRQNSYFKVIEIPLNKIYQEEFKQPLIGKNYLTANCFPIPGGPFGSFSFKIFFKGNHFGTLIGAFYTLLDSLRNNNGKKHDQNIINSLENNKFEELFAIDSMDNTFLYTIQPPYSNFSNPQYFSDIIKRPINICEIYNDNNNIISSEMNTNNNNIKEEDPFKSAFIYKSPNKAQNQFIYKDPGFVYKNPNKSTSIYENSNQNIFNTYE